MTKSVPKPWPRLSESLTGEKHPRVCQSCGRKALAGLDDEISGWLEHDENDQPELTVIVLCSECADKLIEKHPRLYRQLHWHEPVPAIMDLCIDCIHRQGTSCACPAAKANGGDGIAILYPKPDTAFVCGRGRGAKSGPMILWRGAPTACSGREGRETIEFPG